VLADPVTKKVKFNRQSFKLHEGIEEQFPLLIKTGMPYIEIVHSDHGETMKSDKPLRVI